VLWILYDQRSRQHHVVDSLRPRERQGSHSEIR
jgi:hypothetical protein